MVAGQARSGHVGCGRCRLEQGRHDLELVGERGLRRLHQLRVQAEGERRLG
jgi:hypothetical protein